MWYSIWIKYCITVRNLIKLSLLIKSSWSFIKNSLKNRLDIVSTIWILWVKYTHSSKNLRYSMNFLYASKKSWLLTFDKKFSLIKSSTQSELSDVIIREIGRPLYNLSRVSTKTSQSSPSFVMYSLTKSLFIFKIHLKAE